MSKRKQTRVRRLTVKDDRPQTIRFSPMCEVRCRVKSLAGTRKRLILEMECPLGCGLEGRI